MRTIPNMNIIAPCDSIEMKELITQTVKKIKNPLYIRLAKGGDEIVNNKKNKIWKISIIWLFKYFICQYGVMTQECIKVQKNYSKTKH